MKKFFLVLALLLFGLVSQWVESLAAVYTEETEWAIKAVHRATLIIFGMVAYLTLTQLRLRKKDR